MHRFRHALFAFAISAAPLFAETSTWQVDPAHTAAQFTVRHMMISNVKGEFGKVTGTAQYDAADPSKGSVDVTIDATSLTTRNDNRDKHLRSADFFDVEKYPTLTFKSTKVESAGSGKLKLTGDLTIHGTTKQVTFNVDGPTPPIKDQRGAQHMGASATTTINRKDFGLVWNRAMDGGGVVVSDEVTITIDAEFVKQPAKTAALR